MFIFCTSLTSWPETLVLAGMTSSNAGLFRLVRRARHEGKPCEKHGRARSALRAPRISRGFLSVRVTHDALSERGTTRS